MSQNFLSIHAKSFNWAGFFLPKNKYNDALKEMIHYVIERDY